MVKKLLIFSLLFALLILITSVGFAKSYNLDKADIAFFIDGNAKVFVDEIITFDFSGPYTYAYRDLPKGSWTISDIYVLDDQRQPLQFELTDVGDNTRITWYYSANNELKTFTMGYTLTNAIDVYDDVARFNWKVWGQGWDHSLDELVGYIVLPEKVNDPKEVYIWGHPEINGKIGLQDNNKVIFQVFNIPSQQFVELDTVFPRSLLASTEFAVVHSGTGLQKIIDTEKNIYDQEHPNPIYSIILMIVSILILIITFFILKAKYYRKSDKVKDIYVRDIPYNYSPAIVSYLLYINPRIESISAELLNLCLKGKLSIELIAAQGIFSKEDFKFLIKNTSTDKLSKSEILLFDLVKTAAKYGYKDYVLFKKQIKDDTPNELLLSEFKTYLLKNQLEAQLFLKEWNESVTEDAEDLGLKIKRTGIWIFILVWIIVMLLTSFIGVMVYNVFAGTLVFVFGFVILLFSKYLMNRNELAMEHYTKWILLKKYLNNFSDFKNKDVQDIKLWEQYLVYAIPLGCAKKVQKNMKLVFIDTNKNMRSAIFVGSAINYSNIISATNSFSSAFSSAMTTSGSSGFSGGSSGGGGGGGGGAG